MTARPAASKPLKALNASGVSPPPDRPQSRGEEIANSISHGVVLLAVLVAAPFLIVGAAQHGDWLNVVGASVFAGSMALLYGSSTIYHAISNKRAKKALQILDHSAIYLLIAGTYTPFTLGVLRGPWGWTLFGLVWAMALGGIASKTLAGIRYPRLSTILYLGMGWLALIAIKPMWQLIPAWGLGWLVAGGLAYTAGVAFFATDSRVRYGHFVWHLFVALGTACHCIAVFYFA